jgi:hypothetical protein
MAGIRCELPDVQLHPPLGPRALLKYLAWRPVAMPATDSPTREGPT